jgi:hypothetical protein
MNVAPILAALLVLAPAVGSCAVAGAPAAAPAAPADGLAILALEQRAELGGVALTPLRVEEESRCPTGVQCIQAGTVRVAVRIEESAGSRDAVLTLGEPFGLGGGRRLTLAAACPYPRHPGAIVPAAYRFTFAFARGGTPPPPVIACTP